MCEAAAVQSTDPEWQEAVFDDALLVFHGRFLGFVPMETADGDWGAQLGAVFAVSAAYKGSVHVLQEIVVEGTSCAPQWLHGEDMIIFARPVSVPIDGLISTENVGAIPACRTSSIAADELTLPLAAESPRWGVAMLPRGSPDATSAAWPTIAVVAAVGAGCVLVVLRRRRVSTTVG